MILYLCEHVLIYNAFENTSYETVNQIQSDVGNSMSIIGGVNSIISMQYSRDYNALQSALIDGKCNICVYSCESKIPYGGPKPASLSGYEPWTEMKYINKYYKFKYFKPVDGFGPFAIYGPTIYEKTYRSDITPFEDTSEVSLEKIDGKWQYKVSDAN